jgi:hypothetical protein
MLPAVGITFFPSIKNRVAATTNDQQLFWQTFQHFGRDGGETAQPVSNNGFFPCKNVGTNRLSPLIVHRL